MFFNNFLLWTGRGCETEPLCLWGTEEAASAKALSALDAPKNSQESIEVGRGQRGRREARRTAS